MTYQEWLGHHTHVARLNNTIRASEKDSCVERLEALISSGDVSVASLHSTIDDIRSCYDGAHTVAPSQAHAAHGGGDLGDQVVAILRGEREHVSP